MKVPLVMIKLCIILFIIAAIFLGIYDVRAEGSAAAVIQVIKSDSNKDQVSKANIFVGGILSGLGWANTHLLTAKRKNRLYCQPDSLSITKSQMIKILIRYSKNNIEVAKLQIVNVVLKALKDIFPCEEKAQLK